MEVRNCKVGFVESSNTLIGFLTFGGGLERGRNVGFFGGSSIVKF
jgi:hypothetical protein